MADYMQLRRALYFILCHVIERSGDQAWIVVKQKVDDAHLRITVCDGGEDLSEAEVPAIFLPFHRTHRAISGDKDDGLRLTLARQLVEAMRGKMGAFTSPGHGLALWMELPRWMPTIPHDAGTVTDGPTSPSLLPFSYPTR
jgi:signal transduction histidine kinase